jgi:hypothetical protein
VSTDTRSQARNPPHIPKNRDHGLRGMSAIRDVLLNFWEVSQEKM